MRWPTGHTRCPQEVLDIDKVAAATSPGICAPGPPKHGPAWSEARDRPRGSRAEALRNERGGLDSGPVLRLPGSHCPVCEGGLPASQQLLNPPPVSHWEPKDPLECRTHHPSLGQKPSLAAHPAGRICSCGPLTPPPGHQGLSALEGPPASRPMSGPPKELPSLLRRFLPVRWSQPTVTLRHLSGPHLLYNSGGTSENLLKTLYCCGRPTCSRPACPAGTAPRAGLGTLLCLIDCRASSAPERDDT